MNSKELDERIDGVGKDYWHDGITSQSRDDIKQLIRDCIEAVTPQPQRDYSGDNTDEKSAYALKCMSLLEREMIAEIKANTKELLGK